MMSLKKTNKNKAFPESLKMALHNHFCRMNTIIHLPTEEGHFSNQFKDFLDDVDPSSKDGRYLLKQWPDLQFVYESIESGTYRDNLEPIASDFSNNDKGFHFLIQLEMAIPHHKFDMDGNCITTNYSWGCYQQHWVLAQSIQNAAGQAIELARQINREHEQKDRKEFLNKIGAYANAFN